MSITSVTSSVLPAIDLPSLLQRCMGNCTLVAKLSEAFLDSLPSERVALHEAVAINDLNAIARIAHKLRGTAANMCATPLSNVANQVEQAARSNQFDLVSLQLLELNHQIEILMVALSTEESSPI